ncbi:sulfurtransferase complex subunit TusC [Vibrio hepatarius]|uniref:sulfurtransferase complex subunit TusC n=1 Tax=Vibrio hepatarius TaxID=171383 RepID=UPI001C0837E2|nr:sulfurtransferase complex subunit TusC [Vibrio hepatarius]MBU2895587.1 sulfurtransferase complex subunit TusC [Vibrio hepatarius]
MSKLTYLFRTAPHGIASGREGVDALLAASAYCDNVDVIFIGDGVYQLMAGQQADSILSKNYSPMFKLFELYDIEQVFVCVESLSERGILQADLVIDAKRLDVDGIKSQIHCSDKILSF